MGLVKRSGSAHQPIYIFVRRAVPPANMNLVVDGNSIGAGVSGFPPGILVGAMLTEASVTPTVNTIAVAGATTADRIAAAPTDLEPLYNPAAASNVAVLIEIINDACIYDAATCAAHVETWCGLARSYGFKAVVVLGTRRDNGPPGVNDVIDAANALIRASWTTYADGIVGTDVDPRLADNQDPRYFASDGGAWVHPNFFGDCVFSSLIMKTMRGIYHIPFTPGQLPGCQYCVTSFDATRIFNAGGDPISDGEDVGQVIGYGLQAGPASRATGTGFTYQATGLDGKPSFRSAGGISYLVTPLVTRAEVVRVVIGRWTAAGPIFGTESGLDYLSGQAPNTTSFSDGVQTSQWLATDPDFYVDAAATHSIFYQYRGDHASEQLLFDLVPVPKVDGGSAGNPAVTEANMTHYLGDASNNVPAGDYILDFWGDVGLLTDEVELLLSYAASKGYTLVTSPP